MSKEIDKTTASMINMNMDDIALMATSIRDLAISLEYKYMVRQREQEAQPVT